jgi:hypothetical protein
MRKAILYLKDILAALDSIQTFTAGFDVAAFQEDDKTLSAVIRKLEIIGEGAKGLPEVIREQYPAVPLEGDGRDAGPPHSLLLWGGCAAGVGNHSASPAGVAAASEANPGRAAAGSPLTAKISLNYLPLTDCRVDDPRCTMARITVLISSVR